MLVISLLSYIFINKLVITWIRFHFVYESSLLAVRCLCIFSFLYHFAISHISMLLPLPLDHLKRVVTHATYLFCICMMLVVFWLILQSIAMFVCLFPRSNMLTFGSEASGPLKCVWIITFNNSPNQALETFLYHNLQEEQLKLTSISSRAPSEPLKSSVHREITSFTRREKRDSYIKDQTGRKRDTQTTSDWIY